MNYWEKFFGPAIKSSVERVVEILPQFLAAVLILLAGWLVAKIVATILQKALKKVGFDGACERTGLLNALRSSGYTKDTSWLIGRLVFWMLFLVFLLSAAEALNLDKLAQVIQNVVGFIPNLIGVVLILIFGSLLARFLGSFVQGAAEDAGLDFAQMLGKAVNYTILFAISIIAISQLSIESNILVIAFATAIGAFALSVALMLALGCKDIAHNIIAGIYARKSLKSGEVVQIDDVSGELLEIGTVSSVIKTDSGQAVVPNTRLLEKTMKIIK